MPREYGKHYPERQLMGVISDLLGIPHFTTSKGSTVRMDFLRAVASAVGLPDYMTYRKDPLLAALIEWVTGEPMEPSLSSTGATITNEALQTIINGIVENGFLPGKATREDEAVDLLTLDDEALGRVLDPDHVHAPDVRRQLVDAYREEHDEFRSLVFKAYGGRCALTGVGVAHSLKAVHIIPPNEGGPDLVTNGILLRKDIAALLQNGVIAFGEADGSVLVHPAVLPAYDFLVNDRLRPPQFAGHRPAEAALLWRRRRADL